MSQKLKLDSSFYLEEAVVYGLVSQLPAYRLCFFLNERLNLELSRSKEDKTIRFKQKQFYYSRFEQEDKSRGVDWFLIANKNALIEEKKLFSSQEDTHTSLVISGVPLISNLKVMDYFFGYYGEPISSLNSCINGELKDVSYVSTFQKIDIHSTKNIDNLLID
jgi:hypothetical protein